MSGLPRMETNNGLGVFCPRCDGHMFEPPPPLLPTNIDDTFPSFDQQHRSSFEESIKKDLGIGNDSTPRQQQQPTTIPIRYAHNQNMKQETTIPISHAHQNLTNSSSRQYSSSSTSNSAAAAVNNSGSLGGSGPAAGGIRIGTMAAELPQHQTSSLLLQPPSPPLPALEMVADEAAKDMSTQDRFCITVDIKNDYKPDEIRVKTVDNMLVIEGKHEENDHHGQRFVSRNFNRSWTIPVDVDPNAITSRLNAYGQLSVEAPRKPPALMSPIREQMIPVNHHYSTPGRLL